jgi:hypothetical protein
MPLRAKVSFLPTHSQGWWRMKRMLLTRRRGRKANEPAQYAIARAVLDEDWRRGARAGRWPANANQLVIASGRTPTGARLAVSKVRSDQDGVARVAIGSSGYWNTPLALVSPTANSTLRNAVGPVSSHACRGLRGLVLRGSGGAGGTARVRHARWRRPRGRARVGHRLARSGVQRRSPPRHQGNASRQ